MSSDLPSHQVSVALVHPQIAPNTGNVGRLCVATGTALHLVRPLGFVLSDRNLQRAGMDYWPRLRLAVHDDLDAFAAAGPAAGRTWLFTTKADRSVWDCRFADGDCLAFGSEAHGLPPDLLAARPDRLVRIPQAAGERCLNLSTAAGIGLFECLRQLAAGGRESGRNFPNSQPAVETGTVPAMHRVLVVDDHVGNCLPLVRLFKFAGLKAECADGGPQALAVLAVDPPSVVLLDVMMPDMDGFAVLDAIRADRRYDGVAVLMYSAVAAVETWEQALAAGAQGYIVKGLPFDELLAVVRQHLPRSPAENAEPA